MACQVSCHDRIRCSYNLIMSHCVFVIQATIHMVCRPYLLASTYSLTYCQLQSPLIINPYLVVSSCTFVTDLLSTSVTYTSPNMDMLESHLFLVFGSSMLNNSRMVTFYMLESHLFLVSGRYMLDNSSLLHFTFI